MPEKSNWSRFECCVQKSQDVVTSAVAGYRVSNHRISLSRNVYLGTGGPDLRMEAAHETPQGDVDGLSEM